LINGNNSMWLVESDKQSTYAPLNSDVTVDFAIIGGGLSGLWTAYHLKTLDPSATVAVFEAESIASGASGRACGWLSGKPVGVREALAKVKGREAVIKTECLLREAVDKTIDIFTSYGADIGAHKGGTLTVARSESELKRLERSIQNDRAWGLTSDDLQFLNRHETLSRVQISEARGAAYMPSMARVDPAKMTQSLAAIVEKLGVAIHERSSVRFQGRRVTSNDYGINAKKIIVATEGYSAQLPFMKRTILPMNSSLIATAPLSENEWERVIWNNAEGISGMAHTYFYSARTPDNRIAIGGRGKPYRFASGFDTNGIVDNKTVQALKLLLDSLFPQVDLKVDYAWCGVIGVTRDWSPFVHQVAETGNIMLGGYAGQGLTAAYLGGRIASSLALDIDDDYASLPWVRDLPRKWEIEPLRWIGANGLYRVYSLADVLEHRKDSPKTVWFAGLADRIAGRVTK
jgi:glycine/D-amino acid oxidase-like deaminating enzyme